MKHLKKIYEFVNTDSQDISEIKDILSDAIDMGGVIEEIEHRWTTETSLGNYGGKGHVNIFTNVWNKARLKEFINASKVYKIKVSFEILGKELLYASDVMKEMHDVTHKLKIVSDEVHIDWMTNYHGSVHEGEEESNKLVFVIYLLSKTEKGSSDVIKDVFEFVSDYYEGRYKVIQVKDAIRVSMLSNDLMGNPKTKELRDTLDRKRVRIIRKQHKEISEQIKERLDIDIKPFDNDFYSWGIAKNENGRFYPYFWIRLDN